MKTEQEPPNVEKEMITFPNDAIPNYKIAWNLTDQAVRSHYNQWKLFRAIQEHVEGKKPIDPDKLKKQGLEWSSNWNFGKARSAIEKAVAEFVKKVSEALMIGFPSFDLYDPEKHRDDPFYRFLEDPNRRGEVATALGFCYYRALEETGILYDWINYIEYLAYTFGFAPVIWEQHDWMSYAIPVTEVAFRPGSRTDDPETWVVFRTERASDLYRTLTRISNTGMDSYWKKGALQHVIMNLLRTRKTNEGGKFETWEDVLANYNHDPHMMIADTEDLHIACIYQKELDGSITEVYIPWGYAWCDPNNTDHYTANRADDLPYILYKRNYNKTWREFIKLVKDSGFTESGEIHDLRGYGKIATENSIRYNRMRNQINDKAMLVGSPMFEQPSTQTGEKFKITASQGFTLVSPGYSPMEHQPKYDINSQLLIISHEEKEFQGLTSQYSQDAATGKLSSRPTSDEIQLAQAETQNIKSAKDRVKFRDYSDLFHQGIKRIARKSVNQEKRGYETQKLFFKLCKEHLEFVNTDSDVKKLVKLVDGYSIDVVNTNMESLQLGMQLAETPFARNRIKRMMLVANGYQIREINLMVPNTSDKYRAFDDRRVALIENDMFWNTDQVAFSMTDDHMMHFQLHYEKLEETFNKLRQQQLDVIQVYEYVVRLYAHTLQHVEGLMEDPVLKGNAEEYMDQMREVRQVIGQIAYAANRERQNREQAAQQANPGISPKDQHDMRLKQAEAEAQEQRQQFKTEQRGQLMEQELQAKHEREIRSQNLDHQEKMRELQLEHQRELLEKQNEQPIQDPES